MPAACKANNPIQLKAVVEYGGSIYTPPAGGGIGTSSVEEYYFTTWQCYGGGAWQVLRNSTTQLVYEESLIVDGTDNISTSLTYYGYINETLNATCYATGGQADLANAWVELYPFYFDGNTPVNGTSWNLTLLGNVVPLNLTSTYDTTSCLLEWNGTTNYTLGRVNSLEYFNYIVMRGNGTRTYRALCQEATSGTYYSSDVRYITFTGPPVTDTSPPVFLGSSPNTGATFDYIYSEEYFTFNIYTNEPVAACKWDTIDFSYNSLRNNFDSYNDAPLYEQTLTIKLPIRGNSQVYYIGCEDAYGNAMTTNAQILFFVNQGENLGGTLGGAPPPAGNVIVIQEGELVFKPPQLFETYFHFANQEAYYEVSSTLGLTNCTFTNFDCTITDKGFEVSWPKAGESVPNELFPYVYDEGRVCSKSKCYTYSASLSVWNFDYGIPGTNLGIILIVVGAVALIGLFFGRSKKSYAVKL